MTMRFGSRTEGWRSPAVIGALALAVGCGSPAVRETSALGNKNPPTQEAAQDAGGSHPSPPETDAATPESAADAQVDWAADADGDAGSLADATTWADSPSSVPMDAAPDDFAPDGAWIAGAHSPMPTVLNWGGSVLAAPVLTAVTFASYGLTAEAEGFVSAVGASSYWTTVVGEYGIEPATATAPVELAEAPPAQITDTAIQTWLAAELDLASSPFPAPTANSVYILFYPLSTTVYFLEQQSCDTFIGYHNSFQLMSGPSAGATVVYAVVPECNIFAGGFAATVTAAASHEIIESVTDPEPLSGTPTFQGIDQDDAVWLDMGVGDGELADMCTTIQDPTLVPADLPYTVQRSWSNASAAAGRDPCQPEPAGEPFFNATGNLPDWVTASASLPTGGSQELQTRAVVIPKGGSVSVGVDLYSDGPRGDWLVSGYEPTCTPQCLEFVWDSDEGNNGSHRTVTISANSIWSDSYKGGPFEILSYDATMTHRWYGYAVVQ